MRQQFLSKLETARVVHAKELHGCTSSGSSAFDPHTIDLEMFLPMIAARMKERYGLTRKWIDAAEVRSLAEVAAVASEREVVQPIVAPMLLGNDVLNMMSQGAMFLSKQAILATAIGLLRTSFRFSRSVTVGEWNSICGGPLIGRSR